MITVSDDYLQTYSEYLETMKAYNFVPLKQNLWRDWQVYHNGRYKENDGKIINIDSKSEWMQKRDCKQD